MILKEFCQVELYDPWHRLSINSDFDPNPDGDHGRYLTSG